MYQQQKDLSTWSKHCAQRRAAAVDAWSGRCSVLLSLCSKFAFEVREVWARSLPRAMIDGRMRYIWSSVSKPQDFHASSEGND